MEIKARIIFLNILCMFQKLSEYFKQIFKCNGIYILNKLVWENCRKAKLFTRYVFKYD